MGLRLTPTSYIVLGLVDSVGEATPYELKSMANQTVGNFWSLQHAQLYAETERLARAGYLVERREPSGRRRKYYSTTDSGREALEQWRDQPIDTVSELRDPGMLKLFFGADPKGLAPAQLQAHRRRLGELQAFQAGLPPTTPAGPRRVLEAGIAHEQEWIRFWSELAGEGSGAGVQGDPQKQVPSAS